MRRVRVGRRTYTEARSGGSAAREVEEGHVCWLIREDEFAVQSAQESFEVR